MKLNAEGLGNRLRVATLAVGTELTDGQILDRNSQWLSERMVDLQCQIVEHRAVPDDRAQVLGSLVDLAKTSDILFVTGGLGPTSDDFTRDCAAQFLATASGLLPAPPLQWSDEAWSWVEERLRSRGSPITENQKQQCFFPVGTTLLKNNHGTAYGFYAVAASTLMVCLPGPPAEIESIWNAGLESVLREHISKRNFAPRRLSIIRTMGIGEGALAFAVEEILSSLAKRYQLPTPDVGYRAHAPYVEIKLWAEPAQLKMVDEAVTEIRGKFASYFINSDREDVADNFLAEIFSKGKAGRKIVIVDSLTHGEFHRRLLERVRSGGDASKTAWFLHDVVGVVSVQQDWFRSILDTNSGKSEAIEVYNIAAGTGERELLLRHGQEVRVIELPKLAAGVGSDRGRKWVTETALKVWGSSK